MWNRLHISCADLTGFDRSLLGALGSSFVRHYTTNSIEMQLMNVDTNVDYAMI